MGREVELHKPPKLAVFKSDLFWRCLDLALLTCPTGRSASLHHWSVN